VLRKNERVSLFERLKEPGRKPRRAAAGRLTSRELICGTYVHYLAPMQATLEIATNQQDAWHGSQGSGTVCAVQPSTTTTTSRAPHSLANGRPAPRLRRSNKRARRRSPMGGGGQTRPTNHRTTSVCTATCTPHVRACIYIYISNERTEACKNNCAHRGLNPRPQDTYCTAPFNRGKQEKLTSN